MGSEPPLTLPGAADPVLTTLNQLPEIVRLVDDAVGAKALGVYLHGSAVRGGLKPASDVDLLAVTAQTMDDHERRALVDGLMRVSESRMGARFDPLARSLELTVLVQSEVRPWRYPPTADFLYGEWLRQEIEAGGPPRPASMPNLAITVSLALSGNCPLYGPPPAELLDPVPPADVVRGSLHAIPCLLNSLSDDTRNVVLTFSRIWVTLATGEIMSKDGAADWALARLPREHRPVLAHAKELYLTRQYREEIWNDELKARVGPHVEAVLDEIHRLRRTPAPATESS